MRTVLALAKALSDAQRLRTLAALRGGELFPLQNMSGNTERFHNLVTLLVKTSEHVCGGVSGACANPITDTGIEDVIPNVPVTSEGTDDGGNSCVTNSDICW